VLRAGSLDDLLAQDAMVLTLRADAIAPAALAELLSRFGTLEHLGDRVRLHLSASPAAVLAALDTAGARVRHAEFGRGNLEQLFISLTHRSLRDS
jgi:ABC-2 type transport system ATP-binding protein